MDEHKKHGNDFVLSFYSNRKKPAGGHNDTGLENLSYSASDESLLQKNNDVKSASTLSGRVQPIHTPSNLWDNLSIAHWVNRWHKSSLLS